MDSESFQRRKRNAEDRLRALMQGEARVGVARTVIVTDTGVGNPDHYTAIDDRRRANARVERQTNHNVRLIAEIFDALRPCTTPDEVWKSVVLRNRSALGPSASRTQEQGGGVDWAAVDAWARANSLIAVPEFIAAIKAVYAQFWR